MQHVGEMLRAVPTSPWNDVAVTISDEMGDAMQAHFDKVDVMKWAMRCRPTLTKF